MNKNVITVSLLALMSVFLVVKGVNAQVRAFQNNLTIGSTGDDVISLQNILEASGFLTIPAGVVKGFFGPLTKRALSSFQAEVGLPATGFFGPMTRNKMSEHPSTPNADPIKNSALCAAGQQCQDVVVDDCVNDPRWAGGRAIATTSVPMPLVEMKQKNPYGGEVGGGGAPGNVGGGTQPPLAPNVASSTYVPNPITRRGDAVEGGIVPPRPGGDVVSGTISGSLRSGTVRRCIPRTAPTNPIEMPVIIPVPATR